MKKKSISVMLCMVICFGFSSNAFASQILTYDEALKIAFENNLSLERTKDAYDNIDDALEEGLSDKFPPVNVPQIINAKSVAYDELIKNQNLTRATIDVQKDALELGLKNSFVTIENLEKNSTLLGEKITQMRNQLNIDVIRYKVGLLSKMNYDENNLDYEKLQSDKRENDLKLEMAYADLSNILGTENDKKISYIDLPYTPLSTLGLSVNSQIGQAVSQAPSIISQNNAILLLEDKIKYNLLGQDSESLPTQESKIDVKIKDTNMRLDKDSIKNAVISTQNTIQTLEQQITNLESQKKNLKLSIKNLEAAVKVGLKTQLELDQVQLSLKEIELTLENLKNTHQILLERYQKPYLLSLGGEA